jgi:hypothetical protein
MTLMGVKMAVLGSTSNGPYSVITLMSIPSGQNSPEQAQQQFREMMKQQGRSLGEVTEKRPDETFKVRGEDTVAEVGLIGGKDGAENALQYNLRLKGAEGNTVMMMIQGPESVITHDWVQNFLSTVK